MVSGVPLRRLLMAVRVHPPATERMKSGDLRK